MRIRSIKSMQRRLSFRINYFVSKQYARQLAEREARPKVDWQKRPLDWHLIAKCAWYDITHPPMFGFAVAYRPPENKA